MTPPIKGVISVMLRPPPVGVSCMRFLHLQPQAPSRLRPCKSVHRCCHPHAMTTLIRYIPTEVSCDHHHHESEPGERCYDPQAVRRYPSTDKTREHNAERYGRHHIGYVISCIHNIASASRYARHKRVLFNTSSIAVFCVHIVSLLPWYRLSHAIKKSNRALRSARIVTFIVVLGCSVIAGFPCILRVRT